MISEERALMAIREYRETFPFSPFPDDRYDGDAYYEAIMECLEKGKPANALGMSDKKDFHCLPTRADD